MPSKPYKDIKCGTYSGYQLHYRKGEQACTPCKQGASAYVKNYYYSNREKINAKIKERNKNSSKRKAAKNIQKSRRRAKMRGNGYELYTLEKVLELYGTVCHICGNEIDMNAPRNCQGDNWQNGLHIDHVISIFNGGPDTLDNVRPSHALCNVNKNSRNAEKAPTQDFS